MIAEYLVFKFTLYGFSYHVNQHNSLLSVSSFKCLWDLDNILWGERTHPNLSKATCPQGSWWQTQSTGGGRDGCCGSCDGNWLLVTSSPSCCPDWRHRLKHLHLCFHCNQGQGVLLSTSIRFEAKKQT